MQRKVRMRTVRIDPKTHANGKWTCRGTMILTHSATTATTAIDATTDLVPRLRFSGTLQHHAMLFSNDCFINRVGNWMQSSGTLRVFDPGWIRTGRIVAGSGHDGESIVRTSVGY